MSWLVARMLPWIWGVSLAQTPVEQVNACLRSQDVACAEEVVARYGLDGDAGPGGLAWAAEVSYSAGDYVLAYERMAEAVSQGLEDGEELLALYQRAMYATAGWVEQSRDGFRFRYRPGVDAVLVPYAEEALARTDELVTPLLGAKPPGQTIVEIFPDGRSFIAASSLTKDDVESTGVVALSKWTRLLLTSPRALGRGYEWQDTLSHEYIHLVVAHNSHDKAPVWLQEAIAKYLDSRWKGGGASAFQVPVRSQGYLAAALRDNAFVPFEEITALGSLAKIKVLREDGSIDAQASSERAALAYAQLSTLMAYCFQVGGEDVLNRALPLLKEDPRGRSRAREILTEAVGVSSFAELEQGWRTYLGTLNLREDSPEEMPVILDGGDESELDPVLSRRRDLANFIRLGDLLYDRGRSRAALIEYERAKDEEDPNSPMLASRLARALVAQDDDREAVRILEASREDYPSYPMTHRMLGELSRARGDLREAVASFEASRDLDPYSLEVVDALLTLFKELGQSEAAQRMSVHADTLRMGGEELDREPLHERTGDYELPRSPEAMKARSKSSALMGEDAPPFQVSLLDGAELSSDSLTGKVIMLDFWATWCGPCRAIMPELSRMHETYKDQGLEVLSISDELTGTVTRFLAREEKAGRALSQTIALESGDVRRAYGVGSIPTLVVIDRDFSVRLVHVGAGDMGEIERLVQDLLSNGATQ